MNEQNLSKRLACVASYLSGVTKVADIGSDHAYLPCYLCLKNEDCYVVAGEVNEGPYQSAKAQVRQAGLCDQIDVRKGNGLAVLREEDGIEAVVIAGMGGPLIVDILTEGREALKNVHTLVLQPNVAAQVIRLWCVAHHWTLIAEEMIEEDGKIYEVLVAKKESGKRQALSAADLLLGPFLREEKSAVFRKKWSDEVASWTRVLAQLDKSQDPIAASEKRQKIEENIALVREVLQ
ncbi:tRNA (adenine(22)-N(1))-methyltransferase [Shouchella lonarensis]|uniref:tRNA (Adenine22-N1)-methyltransferase n=1 Tax=Shouchella lonarensis TaxID=1464122 RepID=A0A1G6KLY9_9BACI|nr:tRNA (adenine(22)-N(1))-methyltransferase TrmK [Shouchella lonarensis]SDC31831.1 tRNA (adenine22-N1)-methyltransferase [Shouchella lonarensis]